MAMNVYAEPRMTRDVDIVVELASADANRLVDAMSPDYLVDRDVVARAIEQKSLFNLIHLNEVFKVDCIVRKDSAYRRLEFSRRKKVAIGGFETWLVSKEDLVLSKLCWGAPSLSDYQARDVRNLLLTGCDMDYVLKWAESLEVLDYLRKIQSERHDSRS